MIDYSENHIVRPDLYLIGAQLKNILTKQGKIFKIISATLDEWRHTNLPFWIGSEISELLSELFSDSVAVSAANLTYFDLEPR